MCAAPGSWSQVLVKRLNETKSCEDGNYEIESANITEPAKIISVDIQTMAPIDGVNIIQGDITSRKTADRVISEFQGCKAQLVVCDGAPDVTGQHDLDEFIQSQLLLAALNITTFIIETGGTFVAKIFRGKDITLMIEQFRLFFEQVQVVKPKSSRSSSIEAFIVCQNYQQPRDYRPHMFDLMTTVENDPDLNEIAKSCDRSCSLIPFLMCGDLNTLRPTM